jgi:FtsH-binding integral membrane protein
MIWPSGTMTFIISAAGVLIFSGLIAYDTQKIKEQYADAWDSGRPRRSRSSARSASTSTSSTCSSS